MAKKVKVTDLSVKEIITNISESLKTDYEENLNEFTVRIPTKTGSGYIKAFQFDNGIGAIDIDILLKNKLIIRFEEGLVHPLKLIFNRESDFKHTFDNAEEHTVKHLENIITASIPANNHVFEFPANKPICIFSLEINRKEFETKIESFIPYMNEELTDIFRDVNGVKLFYHKSYYSLNISKFIKEFTECELDDSMKYVFLEGKAYEILTHQLQQYIDDSNEPDRKKILRQETVKRIEKAATIIKQELESIDSVAKLAHRICVNQNTLQNGFRHLYSMSVNEYIRNQRIEKARELLENSDLNITEITYKIGINSRSYFSKLFKERFGITPKNYIKQKRINTPKSKSA
ncbi:helix-turn-helix domain-containing protein [Abyssalbus ytuae]|uniref:AraC family transcriptional regulator n=1 Tax=Abyssalbus ytuae TaxID=2926907 RepID=A0A9E6ZLC4_9FLAO|nr:AraC family transcriptional regulator [Abyssalbus ytuae]UOB16729.1 AraC family transcriptional regulator [Abyssalbus ytuae]